MRRHIPRILLGTVLVLTIVLGGFRISHAQETTVEKIVTERNSFEGKEVSVKGIISNIKFRTPTGGKSYTTFILAGESGGRINVFIWGRLKIHPGQKVQVTGSYRKIMRVAQRIYYNLIDASQVK
jgi:hypothetical protein